MEEESNVHMWYSLSEHGREEEKMVVVNHDNIAGLVGFQNPIRKLLVHAIVVCP
jgi:hypothetical protein